MCRAVKCRICGKTTWAGCGSHIAAVKAGVPAGQWCDGHAGSPGESTPRRWSLFRKKGENK
jgi:hypothetical protein